MVRASRLSGPSERGKFPHGREFATRQSMEVMLSWWDRVGAAKAAGYSTEDEGAKHRTRALVWVDVHNRPLVKDWATQVHETYQSLADSGCEDKRGTVIPDVSWADCLGQNMVHITHSQGSQESVLTQQHITQNRLYM